jgi:hypothetical protein
MTLDDWALRWGISPAALLDLRTVMGVAHAPDIASAAGQAGSESRMQSLVRIDAAKQGVWLTRNNVGVLLDMTGRPVRYGLANESKAQNLQVKSADLIGIKPVLIGPQHVGQVIGQFVSRECKHEGWTYRGDAHERAQLAWANFVMSKGGDAAFTTGKYA